MEFTAILRTTMPHIIKLLLYTTLMCLSLPAMSYANSKSSRLIQEIQGVYKSRFINRIFTTGELYQSENIVEIVPVDDSHIYVRAHLEFANAHQCAIWGGAEYENGSFVYRKPDELNDDSPPCVLKISKTKDKLVLTDADNNTGTSTCSMYCGARGSFLDYAMDRSSKRKIRYLKKIKSSPQYIESIEAHKARMVQ